MIDGSFPPQTPTQNKQTVKCKHREGKYSKMPASKTQSHFNTNISCYGSNTRPWPHCHKQEVYKMRAANGNFHSFLFLPFLIIIKAIRRRREHREEVISQNEKTKKSTKMHIAPLRISESKSQSQSIFCVLDLDRFSKHKVHWQFRG